MQRDRFAGLDLLKLLGSFAIAFLFHYNILFGAVPLYSVFSFAVDYGGWFVEIFFEISGFLIYMQYHRRIEEKLICGDEFLLKRMKRLYPAMIISVIFTALVYKVCGNSTEICTLDSFFVSILGITSGWFCDYQTIGINNVIWYISVLLICYIIFYIVESKCKPRHKKYIYFCLMVIGVYLYKNSLDLPFLFRANGRGYLSFFCGCILGKLIMRIGDSENRESYRKNIVWASALLLTICIYQYLKVGLGVNADLIIVCIMFPSVILLCVCSNIVQRISSNRLIYSGGVSSRFIFIYIMYRV